MTFDSGHFVEEIVIEILPREDPLEERYEIFGVQIYDVLPESVRLSSKDS